MPHVKADASFFLYPQGQRKSKPDHVVLMKEGRGGEEGVEEQEEEEVEEEENEVERQATRESGRRS
eukprot:473834-Pyramimonas_sp.AAC.1